MPGHSRMPPLRCLPAHRRRILLRAPAHASMRPRCRIDAPPRAHARAVTPGDDGSCAASWKRPSGSRKPPRSPSSAANRCSETAVRYAEERHWDVFPGTWLEAVGGDGALLVRRRRAAPPPGAHPTRPDWATQATGSATAARRLWSKQPTASVLLPTGRTFDAIDVPETAGFLALARMERMELTLGPVTRTPDRRMLFFVLPGGVGQGARPGAQAGLGAGRARTWWRAARAHYVAAPPTRYGVRRRRAVGPPAHARANRWLPDAEELISPLAYACGAGGGAPPGPCLVRLSGGCRPRAGISKGSAMPRPGRKQPADAAPGADGRGRALGSTRTATARRAGAGAVEAVRGAGRRRRDRSGAARGQVRRPGRARTARARPPRSRW